MKQRNNHARSKRKRKFLRLKNFWKRVFSLRLEKKQKSLRIKGKTIFGEAKKQAVLIRSDSFYDHGFKLKLNQRQKRKLRRQNPHLRKVA